MPSNEVTIRFRVQDDGSVAVLDQAGAKMKALGGESDRTATATGGFNTRLAALGITIAGVTIATAKLIDAGREMVKLYAEDERTQQLRNAALIATNQLTAGYVEQLERQAAALERSTTFTDEQVRSVQRQLVVMGASRDQVADFTPRVLDLAIAMDRDLQGAVQAVGRALAGNYDLFSRFGIKFAENATQAEKYAQVMEFLGRMHGQAATAAQGTLGVLDQTGKAWDNFKEALGETIVKTTGLTSKLEALTSAIYAMRDAVQSTELTQGALDVAIEEAARKAGAAFSEAEIAAARRMAGRRGMALAGEEPDTGFVGPLETWEQEVRRIVQAQYDSYKQRNAEAQKGAEIAREHAEAELRALEERNRLEEEWFEREDARLEREVNILETQREQNAEIERQKQRMAELVALESERFGSNLLGSLWGAAAYGGNWQQVLRGIGGTAFGGLAQQWQGQMSQSLFGQGGSLSGLSLGGLTGGAAASGYAAIIMAGIGANIGMIKGMEEARKRFGATDTDVLAAGYGGAISGSLSAIGLEGLGEPLGKWAGGLSGIGAMAAADLSPAGLIAPGIFSALTMLGAFQPKTPGSIVKRQIGEAMVEALFPRAAGLSTGPTAQQFATADLQAYYGAFPGGAREPGGWRTTGAGFTGITGAATAMLPGALALGAILYPDVGGAQVNAANILINNLNAIGASAEESTRQLQKFAAAQGIDLISGMEALNLAFIDQQLSGDQLKLLVGGLVDIFDDQLPAAIDLTALTLKHFTDQGGIDIAALQKDVNRLFTSWQQGQQTAYAMSEAAWTGAVGLETQVQAGRYGAMSSRQQGQWLRQQIQAGGARITQLAAKQATTGLSYAESMEYFSLLQQQGQYGLSYAQYAERRYGGPRETREMEYGFGVAESAAAAMRAFGDAQALIIDSTDKNTSATERNTQAINALILTQNYGRPGGQPLSVHDWVYLVAQSKTNPVIRRWMSQITSAQ